MGNIEVDTHGSKVHFRRPEILGVQRVSGLVKQILRQKETALRRGELRSDLLTARDLLPMQSWIEPIVLLYRNGNLSDVLMNEAKPQEVCHEG